MILWVRVLSTFRVRGHAWTAKVLSKKEYTALHGFDSIAMCVPKKREIHFYDGLCSIITVRHEIMHSYVYESFPIIIQLDIDRMEELCCELVGRYGHTICNQANRIYKKIVRRG